MQVYETELLYRPDSSELRFLPEGPYPAGGDRLSWVAIQHGPDSEVGSLNLFDWNSQTNRSVMLPGRPGFAFPTSHPDVFIAGVERSLLLVDVNGGQTREVLGGVDQETTGTIINDGVVFDRGLVFGCKDLSFSEQKAGLYFWDVHENRLHQLRNDQVCSNGKAVLGTGTLRELIDIDSPSKTIVRYPFDLDARRLGEPETVVDLRGEDVFPDGMLVTPDGASLIVALYNPNPAAFGELRQYRLADGTLESVWQVADSPQVTCPQLIVRDGRLILVATTAVEHMSAERQSQSVNAGSLFSAATHFAGEPDTPVLQLSDELEQLAQSIG